MILEAEISRGTVRLSGCWSPLSPYVPSGSFSPYTPPPHPHTAAHHPPPKLQTCAQIQTLRCVARTHGGTGAHYVKAPAGAHVGLYTCLSGYTHGDAQSPPPWEQLHTWHLHTPDAVGKHKLTLLEGTISTESCGGPAPCSGLCRPRLLLLTKIPFLILRF